MNATELWLPNREQDDNTLELKAEQCPLCDCFIIDGYVPKRGGASCRRFIVRFDLNGQAVCQNCDKELGPDQVRIKAMSLSPNGKQMIAEHLAERGKP